MLKIKYFSEVLLLNVDYLLKYSSYEVANSRNLPNLDRRREWYFYFLN